MLENHWFGAYLPIPKIAWKRQENHFWNEVQGKTTIQVYERHYGEIENSVIFEQSYNLKSTVQRRPPKLSKAKVKTKTSLMQLHDRKA